MGGGGNPPPRPEPGPPPAPSPSMPTFYPCNNYYCYRWWGNYWNYGARAYDRGNYTYSQISRGMGSLIVPKGYIVYLYYQDYFQGPPIVINGDINGYFPVTQWLGFANGENAMHSIRSMRIEYTYSDDYQHNYIETEHSGRTYVSNTNTFNECKAACNSNPWCKGFFHMQVNKYCNQPNSNTRENPLETGKGCYRICGFYDQGSNPWQHNRLQYEPKHFSGSVHLKRKYS